MAAKERPREAAVSTIPFGFSYLLLRSRSEERILHDGQGDDKHRTLPAVVTQGAPRVEVDGSESKMKRRESPAGDPFLVTRRLKYVTF